MNYQVTPSWGRAFLLVIIIKIIIIIIITIILTCISYANVQECYGGGRGYVADGSVYWPDMLFRACFCREHTVQRVDA